MDVNGPDSDRVTAGGAPLGRRDVLRIGGFSVAAAAVIAACGEHDRGQVGRVGNSPTTSSLPAATVNNVVLLRTASSLEHSIVNVYSQLVGKSDLLDPKHAELAQRLLDDHTAHAAQFEKLTTDAGGKPWTCGNPKIDDVVINPIVQRITVGTAATASATAIGPSDDPRRDMLNFAHGLESLGASTYQTLATLLSEPSLRSEAMKVAVNEARHAALLALTINPDRPGGLVSLTDAANAEPNVPPPTTAATTTTIQNIATPAGGSQPAAPVQQTEIPTVTAIPTQFGSLGSVQLVVGSGDENGTRLKVNLETPSLNSFVFEYMNPSC